MFVWISVLTFSFVLVGVTQVGAGKNVWAGWRESGELHRSAYAERTYLHDVFRTRANTWSNLAYVVLGLYCVGIAWHDDRSRGPDQAAYILRTPALSLTFGLACCYLGVASGLFHASLTRFGQQLDVAAMYSPLLTLLAINIGRWSPVSVRCFRTALPTWPLLVVTVVIASCLLFAFKWSMSSLLVLSSLIASVGLCVALDQCLRSTKLDIVWQLISVGSLIIAVVCRQLDIAGRFTGPDAWLQGHALWHVLTSISLGSIYCYYRSERSTSIAN